MEFRQLGGSGFKVPVLCLGTGTFGADVSRRGRCDRSLARCLASCPNPSRCCPSYPIIPCPTGRFFRGTLSQALRARLRSGSSPPAALAEPLQKQLTKDCV